jgi:hypothetical protein
MVYEYEEPWNDTCGGKPKNSEENMFSATLPTTKPTWTNSGANLGLHGERLVTNHLSHDTTVVICLKEREKELL